MSEPSAEPGGACPLRRRVVEYLRRELAEEERASFERHLDGCAACREQADMLSRALTWLVEEEARLHEGEAWRLAREPAAALDAALDALDEARARALLASASGRRRRVAVAAAALCAIGLLVLFAVPHLPRRGSPEQLPGSGAEPLRSLSSDGAAALSRARSWLLSAQRRDGGWDPAEWQGDARYRVSLSALVLLALGGDDTPAVQEARARGLRYLLAVQMDSGLFGEMFPGAIYNHGLATLAVLEGYGRRSDSVRRDAATRAIRVLLESQVPPAPAVGISKSTAGAWGYLVGDTIVASESITFWALESLLEARRLGWEETAESIERGLAWLGAVSGGAGERAAPGGPSHGEVERTYYRDSGRQRRRPDARPVYAALSLLLRPELSLRRPPQSPSSLRRAVDRLLRVPGPDLETLDFYDLYLYSRALSYAHRGPARVAGAADVEPEAGLWKRGDAACQLLLARQVVRGPLGGSWEPTDRWGHVGGRLYSTALAALTLRAR